MKIVEISVCPNKTPTPETIKKKRSIDGTEGMKYCSRIHMNKVSNVMQAQSFLVLFFSSLI